MAQLFLCLGGPQDGMILPYGDIDWGYLQYSKGYNNKETPEAVMIWKGLLNTSQTNEPLSLPRPCETQTPREQNLQVWEEQRTI